MRAGAATQLPLRARVSDPTNVIWLTALGGTGKLSGKL